MSSASRDSVAGRVGSRVRAHWSCRRPASAAEARAAPRELAVHAGLDLAARLRACQRALRSRVERRDALLDIVRAVNATLEPREDRRADRRARPRRGCRRRAGRSCRPTCRASSSVLAERGLTPDMGPARLRRRRAGSCSTARSSSPPICADDPRVHDAPIGGGRRVSADVPRPPRRRAHRPRPRVRRRASRGCRRRCCAPFGVLLEPAAVALDNALLLKRAEALSVTDDLTQPLQLALPEPGAAPRDQARVAQRPAAVAAVHRPRRLQGGQRHARPSVRQPRAGRGGGGHPRQRAGNRRRGAVRRRRVRAGPARHRRRGRVRGRRAHPRADCRASVSWPATASTST